MDPEGGPGHKTLSGFTLQLLDFSGNGVKLIIDAGCFVDGSLFKPESEIFWPAERVYR